MSSVLIGEMTFCTIDYILISTKLAACYSIESHIDFIYLVHAKI